MMLARTPIGSGYVSLQASSFSLRWPFLQCFACRSRHRISRRDPCTVCEPHQLVPVRRIVFKHLIRINEHLQFLIIIHDPIISWSSLMNNQKCSSTVKTCPFFSNPPRNGHWNLLRFCSDSDVEIVVLGVIHIDRLNVFVIVRDWLNIGVE